MAAKSSKSSENARPSEEVRQTAELLKQVSDPTRLQVLMLLTEKSATSPSFAPIWERKASPRSAITWPCSGMVA